jgi:hypothetical protein
MRPARWRAAAVALALLLGLCLAAELWHMPVQVSDSLGEILDAQASPSPLASFLASAGSEAYLRPLRIAQIKLLYDAAQGTSYRLVYRGFHALLIVCCLVLFVRVLRVTTAADFACAALALSVLLGLHTFRGTVQEAFPINHFLEITVLTLLVVDLARSRGGWLADGIGVVTFVVAALTLESGLLVWVGAITARIVGWRGLSNSALVVMTALLGAYFTVRFGYLETGTPSLSERSAGFLFTVLEPPQLEARFGADPLPFYAYNVATSALSVLLSEPRAGVFVNLLAWKNDALETRHLLQLATSAATTVLMLWAAVDLLRRRRLTEWGGLLALCAALLAGNALLSFAYTKDEIMTVSGAFYGVAAFAAARYALQRSEARPLVRALVAASLLLLCAGWSVRAAGLHYLLRAQAFRHQNDWAGLPQAWQREGRWPTDPGAAQVIRDLHDEAVTLRIPNVRAGGYSWVGRVWED